MNRRTESNSSGPALAVLSAGLFGISPVFVKSVIGEISPVLLAGLLYLGSGPALLAVSIATRDNPVRRLKRVSAQDRKILFGAIVSGGVIAPLLLTFGLKYASAFETSVLLNLETVATTLIAYFLFHEHVGRRVWISKLFLVAGAMLILLVPGVGWSVSVPGTLILGACLFWGLDNNLTRELVDLPPLVLAGTKGLCAGAFNVTLAYFLNQGAISPGAFASTLGVGALSYGVSLVLFVKALRLIGSSRTSTYFATGPFWGMLLAILLLGEHPSTLYWTAAGLMGLGVLVLYRENHSHVHTHEEITARFHRAGPPDFI